ACCVHSGFQNFRNSSTIRLTISYAVFCLKKKKTIGLASYWTLRYNIGFSPQRRPDEYMRSYNSIAARVRAAAAVAAVALIPLFGACSDVTDTLLEAVDPDIIAPQNANSAEGALALYSGALG